MAGPLIILVVTLIVLQTLLACALLAHAILQLSLVRSSRWAARRRARLIVPSQPARLPRVTIQLPIYNELNVIQRLLACVTAIDYPRGLVQIQVLDDSDDGTTAVIAAFVSRQRAHGVDINHLHRRHRTGYKAGALADALATATGDLIAIFDADFMPEPGFLRATIGHFGDPAVGAVQARWGISHQDGFVRRVEAVMIDSHFGIEQCGRSAQGCFINFNGSAGAWRVSAIRDAGGWSHDTLTEDLDISFRAQLRGWRIVYLDDVVAEMELPQDVRSLRIQQYRWMKGVAQNALRLAPRVLRARLPMRVKVHALAQLFESCLYSVTLGVPLLSAVLVQLAPPGVPLLLGSTPPAFVAGGVLIWAGYVVYARRELRRKTVWPLIWQWLRFFVATLGLSAHNTAAVVDGLTHKRGTFNRTPKQGAAGGGVAYTPRGIDRLTYLDLAVVALFIVLVVDGTRSGRLLYMWLPLLTLAGLLTMLGLSFRQTYVAAARRRERIDSSSLRPA